MTQKIDFFLKQKCTWLPSWCVNEELLKFNGSRPSPNPSCRDDRFLWAFNLLQDFTEKRQKFKDRARSWRMPHGFVRYRSILHRRVF